MLWRRSPGKAVDLSIAVVVVAVLAAPLAARSSEPLDFVNHLWLVWAAGKALAAAGHPSYFINTTTQGVFNPWFAFYGGTLYQATGALSELLGRPYAAYAIVIVAAMAAAYGGTLWLSRQFGLRGLVAHAPALAAVTSAYFVADLYQRGAWPEFVALAAIPPLAASTVWLVRAPFWRPAPVAVCALSAVIVTGSHNITLLWGLTVTVLVLVVTWLALGAPRRLPYRRFAMVAGLGVTAALVNGWFLLTDVGYAGDTFAATYKTLVAGTVAAWDRPGNLFDPLRSAPYDPKFPDIYVQVPDWFLAWALVAGAILLLRGRGSDLLRRLWVAALIVIVALLAITIANPFWSHVPYPFAEIQFPFRINGYLLYVVAGLVLVSALALQGAGALQPKRRSLEGLRAALIAVAAVSAGLCLWQEWAPATSGPGDLNRGAAFVSSTVLPPSWYDAGSYLDHEARVVAVPPGRVLTIEPTLVRGDRFSGSVDLPAGTAPIQTNIAGGDYVVKISGLRWLGRSAAGYAVVARLHSGSGPVHVVIETARTAAMVIGSILSILALVALLAILILTSLHARRARRRERQSHSAVPAPSGS